MGLRTHHGRRLPCLRARRRQCLERDSPRSETDGCFCPGIVPVQARINGREPGPASANWLCSSRSAPGPDFGLPTGCFWVFLRQVWRHWVNALIVVKPETVVGWQRQGFKLFWRWISRAKPAGRPRIPKGGTRAHPTDGPGEWLGSASNSRRTAETGHRDRRAERRPLSAQRFHLAGPATALVSLSAQPSGCVGGDGLFHRPDGDLRSSLGLG